MATGDTIGLNRDFPIYNADGTAFNDLVLKKAAVDSIIMSLGDKITGDVYYKDNTLAVTMQEYIEYKRNPDDEDEDAVKYMLINPPTVVREGMASDNGEMKGMTKYSFTFYHPMCLLANFPFSDVAVSQDQTRYLSENKTFSWIGTLQDYVEKLNKNLEGTQWIVVINYSSVAQEDYTKLSDVLTFDKQSIADALKTGYETWKVPYVVESIKAGAAYYSEGKRFMVWFGLPTEEIYPEPPGMIPVPPFVFKFGQGVGLKNNSRTPRNNKIITRIAGYGSEDNIPYGYPQIQWYGNQDWDYTINNDATDPHSYPIYKGIVGGAYVKLIKHPFTRTHLMPSVYVESLFNKISPYTSLGTANADYDPDTELVDYYDAVNEEGETPEWENPIVEDAPSYEIHEFTDIKPELGDMQLVAVETYDDTAKDAISMDEFMTRLNDYYSESENEDEKDALQRLMDSIAVNDEDTEWSSGTRTSYQYDWRFTSDGYFKYVTYKSSLLNFENTVLLNPYVTPTPEWDDTMDDDGNYVQSYFKVTLPALGFDLYACAAITQEMSVNMRSGACIGCTFPVMVDWDDYKKNFYDADGNFDPVIGEGHPRDGQKYPDSTLASISVVLQKDNTTFGTLMPNIYQQPASGNKFVILGISLPQSYVTIAESRLDNDMIQYMHDNNVYYYDYPLKFDEHFLATHAYILSQMRPNVVVRFEYADETHALYIKQMTVKYGNKPLPEYNITLTDDVEIVLNQIGQVTQEVSNLRLMLGGGDGTNTSGDTRYLRKDKDDTAQGLIRFMRGVQVGERFVTGLLGEGGIFRMDDDGHTYLECDRMYVRLKAYFDTVEVRKYMHSGGNRIASPAGMNCSRVEYYTSNNELTTDADEASYFRCYFRADDNGKRITNDFIVGDLAYCKETNVDTMLSQHQYWRLITGVSVAPTADNEHYIDLANAHDANGNPLDVTLQIIVDGVQRSYTCAAFQSGSDAPIAEDDIIQLGNIADKTRQGAIVEYVSGEDAPSYQIYQGIDSYSLLAKNYVRLGYDSESGGAQAYIGNPDGSTYLWYHLVTEGGVTTPQLDIKANVEFTAPDPVYGTENLNDFVNAITQDMESIEDMVVWFGTTAPTMNNYPVNTWEPSEYHEHIGDLFYDKTNDHGYRFVKTAIGDVVVFTWELVDDNGIIEALRAAAKAQDTADGKRRVFLTQPTPPYDTGDIWVNATYPANYDGATDELQHKYHNDILKCIAPVPRTEGGSEITTFSIYDWTLSSKYTDDSRFNHYIDVLTNGIVNPSGDLEVSAAAQHAINVALKDGASTIVNGGLVLTNIIALLDGNASSSSSRVMSGINGTYNSTLRGGGIAAWYGGPMVDHEASPSASSYAKTLFRFDGTGYLAGGNITWNANGSGSVAGGNLAWNENGQITSIAASNTITVGGSDVLTQSTADSRYVTIDFFNRLFQALDGSGNTITTNSTSGTINALKFLQSVWSTGAVSALGANGSGGGGSSLVLNNPLLSINGINANPTTANSLLVWNGTSWGYKTTSEIGSSYAATAGRLSDNTSYTAWGQTFFTNGVPTSISNAALSGVTDINTILNFNTSLASLGIRNIESGDSDTYSLIINGNTWVCPTNANRTTLNVLGQMVLKHASSTTYKMQFGTYTSTYQPFLNFHDSTGQARTVLTITTQPASVGRTEFLEIGQGFSEVNTSTSVVGRTNIYGGNIHFFTRDTTDTSSTTSVVQSMRIYTDAKTFIGSQANHTSLANINNNNGHSCSLNTYTALIGKLYLYKPNAANDTNAVWFEYDSTNGSVKLNGSFYATGGVSALGIVGSGGGSSVTLGNVLNHINTHDATSFSPSTDSVLLFKNGVWGSMTLSQLGASVTTDCVKTSGTQIIGGAKTFSDAITIGSNGSISSYNGFVIAGLSNANDYVLLAGGDKIALADIGGGGGNYVTTDTNQDITGVKTFKANVTIGTSSTNNTLVIYGRLGVGMATDTTYTLKANNRTYLEKLEVNGAPATGISANLYVNGATYLNGATTINNSLTIPSSYNLNANGSVGIGTTAQSGYKLYVNGATYLNGNTTVNGTLSATTISFTNLSVSGTSTLTGKTGIGGSNNLNYNLRVYANTVSGVDYGIYAAGLCNFINNVNVNGYLTVGQNSMNTSYKLYVNGDANISGALTVGTFSPTNLSISGKSLLSGGVKAYTLCVECNPNGEVDNQYSGEINRFNNSHLHLQYHSNTGGVTMCIGGGNVAIGTSVDSSYKLKVNGTSYFTNQMCIAGTPTTGQSRQTGSKLFVGGNTSDVSIYANGLIYSQNSEVDHSDIRNKNIYSFIDDLTVEGIGMAPVFRFKWKNVNDNRLYAGTSAQYWQNVLPQTVFADDEGWLGMSYGQTALISTVITARKVVDHEHRIQQLEWENERLRKEIEQLKAA